MIRGYSEQYLDDAQKILGEAFDYAFYSCKVYPDTFMEMFLSSGLAKEFANGSPRLVSGISGTELAISVLKDYITSFPGPRTYFDFSPEYWAGWILAYYQWYTGRSFENIHQYISMETIIKMYSPLHEAPEEKFVETVNKIIESEMKKSKDYSRLQTQRKYAGLTQKELSEKAEVNLRTLQQYETKAKDINKTAGETLLRLSKVLGCQIEDILEL